IDSSGSVYIANHCGGRSTTQYCCATLKTDEKKDSSEGLDFVRTAEEIAIQQMMAKIEALKESIRKTLPVETPAGSATIPTTKLTAKKIMENELTYESSGVGTTLG
ncbi:hypothetical protein GW922_02195, partial [Candidatus Pacearchaeota archaeon]|nr:hypothetical protein [Candidatus Pacearchaeota archaeon]